MNSILERARTEGWSDGWRQGLQVSNDEARDAGRQQAEAYAPSRLKWFILGALFTLFWTLIL